MPGVPSGRACDACRKQKKKCDETKPSCSRCIRLQIECVGSGQRRYKFEEPMQLVCGSKSNAANTGWSQAEARRMVEGVPRPPNNELTRLVAAFTARVHAPMDPRYSLLWAYGLFLIDVPRRLGTNEALDAAASALVTAYPRFICPREDVRPQVLAQYSQALQALRKCLNDPVEAYSANTLCAVMILLICQAFIGSNGNRWSGHCEGVAQILKAKGLRYQGRDKFERTVLLSLRGPVVFEGIVNRRIALEPDEWEALVENELGGIAGADQTMNSVSRVPVLIQRGREAFKNGQEDRIAELRDEARRLYDSFKSTANDMKEAYLAAASKRPGLQAAAAPPVFTSLDTILYAHAQRMHGLTLTVLTILNAVVRAFCPDTDIALENEATQMAKDILTLAEASKIFRPLGASYIQLSLIAACTTTSDPEIQESAESLWEDYQAVFPRSIGMDRQSPSRRIRDPLTFRHLFSPSEGD